MAVIGTGLTLPGARSEFFDAFEKTESHWQDLASVIKSNKDIERHRWLGSVPQLREWATGRKARGLYAESFDVGNLKYECTLEVDRDEIADDQTGQIMQRVRSMGERAASHKDMLLSALLAHGHESGFHSYDGSPMFSATHESGLSGAQTNVLTPAAVDTDAPTTAEFMTALKAAITALLGLKDDQGEPMSVSATGLVCVVPASMYLTALETLQQTTVSGTTNVLASAAKVLAFPRLTDTSKWFLLKTNVQVRPFILQDREPLEFKALEGDSEKGFSQEVYEYGVRARYRMTYGYWQYALSNDFTVAE